MHSNRVVSIGVYGEEGTGKSTLITALDGSHYIRNQDNQSFILSLREGTGSQIEPSSFAVVLVDATNPRNVSPSTIQAAIESSTSFCFLFTKTDLIAQDYSSAHTAYLWHTHNLAYKYNTDCFSTSTHTKDGMTDLIAYAVDKHSPPPHQRLPIFVSLWPRFRDLFLDCIAACFKLPSTPITPNVDEELTMLSRDDAINELIAGPLSSAWSKDLIRRLRVEHARSVPATLITPSLIVKSHVLPSEPAAMEFVRQHTSIPIPRIHLRQGAQLVMDFIKGEMLFECWDSLSWFMQFRIACTLRLYIKQLRSLTRVNPGGVEDCKVVGSFFDEGEYGPFDGAAHLRRFCDLVSFTAWRSSVVVARSVDKPPPPLLKSTIDWSPVFMHGDLNMSNILLDERGTLWLIDWDSAGFYPASLESLSMQRCNEILKAPSSWENYRTFIAGATCDREERYWYYFEGEIHRYQ
ncbi:hypothetical protein P691DRAFT_808500 [Macrolepiota fuliginosa MF-IS2]|uniref:Aminoglycoside phosphotransferase domain-containing protein n=1 Tax=Macrolepiota fuliginosa MF-IS2 TaxID=1400762 RepID=A0A9P5XRB3_9AGAR|nr:hypothetical protein P691DRAFT_808500 [Macrolepiota fuliginosa MF-IS2]